MSKEKRLCKLGNIQSLLENNGTRKISPKKRLEV